MQEEIDDLKSNVENIRQKNLDLLSQINSDSTSLTLTRHESDLMDIKTEIITLRQANQQLKLTIQPDKLNIQVRDLKVEIDNVIKDIKHDIRTDKFDSKILELQNNIDDIKNNAGSKGSSVKFDLSSKVSKISDLNQVNIEVQRLSDGLNNLFRFTQA